MIRVMVRLGLRLVLYIMLSKLFQIASGFVFFSVKWSRIRGTFPWSFVTQIYHNGQPSRVGVIFSFLWGQR
jgi:hypothetical protein